MNGFWRQAATSTFRGWSARRHGVDRLPITVERRRIYILPTGAGLALAAALAVMLITALNYGNNLGLAFAFLTASIALVAMHHCHRNLLQLRVDARAAADGFADSETVVEFTLHNDSPLDRYDIEIRCAGAAARCAVRAGARRQVAVALAARPRGILRIEQFELRTQFPFGWFRAWTYVQAPLVAYIAPAPRGGRRRPEVAGEFDSGTHSETRGDEEFSSLRAYAPGVPLKQMAWKVLARGGEPMVRSYTSSAAASAWLDWFALDALDPEARLSQLCLWVLTVDAARRRYGLRLPGLEIAPAAAGTAHRTACLRALAAFTVEAGP